jgi:hypothetical protein
LSARATKQYQVPGIAWKADTLHAGFKTVWEALEAMVIMACAHEAESPFTRQKHNIQKRMREKTLDLPGTEHIQKRSSWSLSRQPRLMCSWSSPKVGVSHVAGFVQQRGYAHKSKWSLGARKDDDQMINL